MKRTTFLFPMALLLLLLSAPAGLRAQARAFGIRYNNASVRGNIVMVSNSIVTSFSNADPFASRTEIPPAGTSDNNVGTAVGRNIDVDGDASTFNSSTSDLSLLPCSNVLFAGLYWTSGWGQNSDESWITGHTTCKLKLPGDLTYRTITSTQTDRITPTTTTPAVNYTTYQCFANITAIVQALANPNGTYTVADVRTAARSRLGVTPVPDDRTNLSGGWTIVIVYGNPLLQLRSLTVFDGAAPVRGGSSTDVAVNGFLTPPGGPVSCELGVVTTDGDRGTDANSQDGFEFRQGSSGPFVNLALTAEIPMSGNADMWNSSITYRGTPVATRNPAYQNTLGYDADIVDLPNTGNARLGNSQTTATVRFSTPSESYTVSVLTTSISVYNPTFSFDKTATDVNGGTLVPGDIIRYRINYSNVGNDVSTNTIITDNIPAGTAFVPNSIIINGTARTDAAGDDQAEYDFTNNRMRFRIGSGAGAFSGGNVPSSGGGSTGYVEFSVYTPSSCRVVSCMGSIRNSARIDFRGQTTSDVLLDSSGVNTSGCITKGPVINTPLGSCYNPLDTILENSCPGLNKILPVSKYAGYTFYNSTNFIPANVINPYLPITTTRVVYAYFNAGAGCRDTIQINVYINGCPDIDDDNDGIPDYVEAAIPGATADDDGDGRPNWYDTDYPGYVDNNLDGSNDNFDPAADSDNDGIPNFYDTNFPGYTDSNGDAMNDNFDKDLDGIPNILDLDSDNDGIPDTVESFGVDADGDGRIDNYADIDGDGLSDNVDANTGGGSSRIYRSGSGLGELDTDGDGLPNYLELDSDNDGIPDVTEAYGTDTDFNGKYDGYKDIDGDGYNDVIDADVGNDIVMENGSSSILKTSSDGNSDGKCDTWPNKNPDGDSKPNPYDMDSDMDGILDVIEGGFPDTNHDGRIDGSYNADGWSTSVANNPFSLPDTDAAGRADLYDIDSDNDGIPDNVEGLSTAGYLLPAAADADSDGLDDRYDNVSGFGGNGIPPVDHDGDGIPDYRDDDTDADGVTDIVEGNDFNLNGIQDDVVTLLGTDADDDGLDDRFDTFTGWKGTSGRMGNGGSFTGDASPGSNTPVQLTPPTATDRDWRHIEYLLNCEFMSFKATLAMDKTVNLGWTVYCRQELDYFTLERSLDGVHFSFLKRISALPVLNETTAYRDLDNVAGIQNGTIYYRLKATGVNGRQKISNVAFVKTVASDAVTVQITPNPVRQQLTIILKTIARNENTALQVLDCLGRPVCSFRENITAGTTTLSYNLDQKLPAGIYYIRIKTGGELITRKFTLLR